MYLTQGSGTATATRPASSDTAVSPQVRSGAVTLNMYIAEEQVALIGTPRFAAGNIVRGTTYLDRSAPTFNMVPVTVIVPAAETLYSTPDTLTATLAMYGADERLAPHDAVVAAAAELTAEGFDAVTDGANVWVLNPAKLRIWQFTPQR